MPKKKPMGVIASLGYMLRTVYVADKATLLFSFYKQCSEELFNAFFVVYSTRAIYSIIQEGGAFTSVLRLVLAFCGIQVIVHITSAAHAYYIRLKTPEVYRHMFAAVMDKAQRVGLRRYEQPEFYNTFARALDDCLIKAMDGMYAFTLAVGEGLAVVVSIVLVAAVDPWLVAFLIPPVLLSFWLGGQRNRLQFDLGNAETPYRRAMDYAKRVFYEKKYAGEIRLYKVREVLFKAHVDAYQERHALTSAYNRRIFFRMAAQQLTMFCLMSASIAVYVAYVIKLRGTENMGAYVAVLMTAGFITYKAGDSVQKSVEAGKHCIFMNNYRDFLDCPEGDGDDGADQAAGAKTGLGAGEGQALLVPGEDVLGDIEFRDVRFAYEGSVSPVLDGLSFSIRRGEKIALVGENGAGKTTLVKLLMGLYPLGGGQILVNGRDIGRYDGGAYRQRFGAVFQDLQVFSLSLAENVLLREPRDEADRELVRSSLVLAQFGDVLSRLSEGIDSQVTKEFDPAGFVCSGGQAQKIAIARVFAKRPDIVILDEPSSALDPIAEYYMYENMMKACQGRTVFFISHRLSSARLADRVIYLEAGRVLESGSHRELMDSRGRYATMFDLQARNYREQSYQTVEGEALYGQ